MLGFGYNLCNTNYTQQLKWSKTQTLQHRHWTMRFTMLYKITTGQACVSCSDLKLQPASGRRSHRSLQYQHFSYHMDYRSNTFPRTVKDWNKLYPQMQFCPSPMAPSSRRCHPPPNKFQNFPPLPVSLSTLCNTLK